MKVLVVDDEPLVRRSLERLFMKAGHEVAQAADGVTGLSKWRDFHPEVVFLDVLMPEMTGPELLDKIEPNLRKEAKVILMSAYSGNFSKESGDFFLAKPFQNIDVVVKIAEELVAQNKNEGSV